MFNKEVKSKGKGLGFKTPLYPVPPFADFFLWVKQWGDIKKMAKENDNPQKQDRMIFDLSDKFVELASINSGVPKDKIWKEIIDEAKKNKQKWLKK